MQRVTSSLGIGAFVAAALLAACGGGGGGSQPGMLPAGGSNSATSPISTQSGTRLTVVINRTVTTRRGNSTTRKGAGSRSPLYVSTAAKGLQVAVSTTNPSATKTIYADISQGSGLCTPATGADTTCTLTIPTLGASEQIVATEVDTTPANEVLSGSGAYYGTGFPTGSNILAVGTGSVTISGAASLTLGLAPVAGGVWFDCSGFYAPPGGPPAGTTNFAEANGGYSPGRIVFTAGVASEGLIEPEFEDAASPTEGFADYDTTPLPFVDVNGSPTPITITASSSGLSFAPMVNNGTPPPAGAFTTTASIANDGYEWLNCIFVVAVKVAANFSGTSATVTVNNNLTAPNPFLSPPAAYPQTYTYWVSAVTASAVTGSPAVTGPVFGYITGTDYQAVNGMDAESVVGARDERCEDGGGTVDANVIPESISTTTWQQVFRISPVAAGTCTFVLYDLDTGVPTQTVSVTVGS